MQPPSQQRSIAAALLALAASLVAVPSVAAPAPASPAASAPVALTPLPLASKTKPAAPVKRIDINSASRKELKTLPGIGDAEVDKLIAARPFLTKTELVTKQVLATGAYLSLKNLVVAMPTKETRAMLARGAERGPDRSAPRPNATTGPQR